MIEALGSDGNLRSCLSGQGGLGGYSESRSGRSGSRVKAFHRIRVGSWNVGSLTSKLSELVDALERHIVDIACFQETKWKGSSNKEVNGYKLWYPGSQTARNGVGVILRACLKDKVVHVNRCNDRIMSLTLVIEGETVNVISAYAPQVGEACSSQHRLLAMDTLFKRVQRRKVGSVAPRILWKNLNGDAEEAFRSRVSEGVSAQIEAISASDANSMWKLVSSKMQQRIPLVWLLGPQRHIRLVWNLSGCMKRCNLKSRRNKQGLKSYLRARKAKEKAYEDLYKILDSKDGANEIFRIAKARQRRRRDLGDICFIKDEAGRTIMDEEEIKQKWGEYFSFLFNTREPEGHEGVVDQNTLPLIDCYYLRISQTEVRTVVQKMGRNKAAIHLIRSLMEKYRERQRDLHLVFIDLEKAYDSVPRDLIWKTLIDKGASRRYIKVIMDMYNSAKTRVRTSIGNTKFFPVEVGLLQGSTISPYLFALILDKLSRGIQDDISWCIVFADDIVLVSESAKGLNDRLDNWKEALEVNSLRVSREKTEYLRCDFKCWPITKALANRMEVAELRMLRWTYGKTMLDMIPNRVYRAELEVETIINKMRKGRLRWFRHVRRRPQSALVRRVEALVVDGMRRSGRPKLRLRDKVKLYMKDLLLSEDMTSDRNEWRARTSLEG
uniref:Retrovirus-related Pol polyprotein LINE-1 n=1 Tax=Tanacetum cinerariifolium TaxID=118510 RepID=A0A6L2M6T3_TANCI|nr:retrovirus-related Pol polyprotein LINE-1 [Tanacetum cinerariifolium]